MECLNTRFPLYLLCGNVMQLNFKKVSSELLAILGRKVNNSLFNITLANLRQKYILKLYFCLEYIRLKISILKELTLLGYGYEV